MRRLVLLLLVLSSTLALPAAAHAHDVLERTTPAGGTTVDTLPSSVVLTFSDDPVAIGAQVVVTGPKGDATAGPPTLSGRDVVQALAATSPGGDYTVTYRVTSSDGHPIGGTFTFHARVGLDGSTATAPPTMHVPTEDASAAQKESQFVPVMLTIAGTVVLLAVGGYVLLRGRGA